MVPEVRDPLGPSYPIGKLDLLIVWDELGLAFVLLIPWEGVKLLHRGDVLLWIHVRQRRVIVGHAPHAHALPPLVFVFLQGNIQLIDFHQPKVPSGNSHQDGPTEGAVKEFLYGDRV